ncbi:sodium-dependent dicarboxylate transporter 2/3/5 [Algoriphagus boseongensis]|uniref:Sodium-dependent dicarboxylate transporter 2/3/5 n=1 Tax=Algoriphagus boseongensis TaxID=1442587 RepID=A0A4R6TBH3_9BACT|nr:DASS family sodium-coupled anion symporter [Algoriphagus boseongensis]TDQ19015.1 sodium-dependent dicarboxylate transporter 2/3/5 [Algoriphagus boseongensis]
MTNWLSRLGLFLGPTAFLLILFLVESPGLNPEAQAMLALTVWMAIWWITEALPIAGTALLPLIFMPTLGLLKIDSVSSNYMHPTVMLYMGGFLLATGIEKWNLHRRIALNIINLLGTNLRMIVLGFILATGFLSMWISNSATALMMLPIGLAVVSQFKDQLGEKNQILSDSLGKNIMLGIAYSASIGGMATLIGTPTNAILSAVVKELYDYSIAFNEWMLFGFPFALILLIICWLYLVTFGNKLPKSFQIEGGKSVISTQLKALGKITFEEKSVLVVFTLVCFSWISRSFLLAKFIPGIDDTIIVLAGVVALLILPSSTPGKRILDWKTAEKIPWGVLILFGGGLALAEGFKETGLAEWIGQKFTLIEGVGFFVLLMIIIASVNFLTEVTSNVATASMLLPILASVAIKLDLHPFGLMVGATLAASCAFMLPVATPPNAVVFGSGYLQMKDMVKAGLWLNIFSIILITLMVYYILPWLWGIELMKYPF